MMRNLRSLSVNALLLAVLAVFSGGCAHGSQGQPGADDAGGQDTADGNETAPENGGAVADKEKWTEVERLISEDKFEAASRLAGELRAAAQEAGDGEDWTRALIKEVQLRTGLHGYETAVRFLRQEPWPEGALHCAVLHLFYGRSLVTYFQAYSWEISQRERVETGEEIDLKAWTRDQIVGEAQRAYFDVWQLREEWGSESIGRLAEYLDQNTYPARIRGTLRDAVTYLWVELLADTSLWRPEQSNELYQLDLAALLGDEPPDVTFDDGEVHPLEKIAAILADLESWHRGRQQPEAGFAARLERLKRLWGSFSQADDRLAVRRQLERSLDRLGRRYEWWSQGMAELAVFVRGSDDANSLAEARRIALEGAKAHPDSAGGKHCARIVAEIEAPAFELMAMAVDGADRRSIQIRHKNIEELHFRAYTIDLLERVAKARDYNFLPAHREVPQILASQKPAAEWRIELPETPDYRMHQTFAVPPMVDPGAFLVVASARRDFAQQLNQQHAVHVVVSDLVLLTRFVEKGLEVTARSGRGGEALSGAQIDLYRFDYRKGHSQLESRTTGASGRVTFPVTDLRRSRHFLLGRRGDDLALNLNLGRYRQPRPAGERTAALVYTDRSVYRPRQKILWKVVGYSGGGEGQRYRTLPDTELTVELIDANGQNVASAKVSTNAFGSASGEFPIPGGRLLGGWHVRTSLGGSTSVQVEEYKRPTFEVTVSDPEAAMRLNREATLTGEVRYYFGLPVVSGEVSWRVTREPVYPRWGWHFWRPPGRQSQIVASGRTTLDADGRFHVTFTPRADERLGKRVSYRYRLAADVTDEGGETRSASRAFRLGFVAVEALIDTPAAFLRQGEDVELTVRRLDLDGVPRAGSGSWRLVALEQPESAVLPADQPPPRRASEDDSEERFATPGDRLRPRWDTSVSPQQIMGLWDDGKERRRGKVEHGDDGEAKIPLAGLPAGAYRLRYTTTDDFGAEYETASELVVVAEGVTPLALPSVLMAERPSVTVGEKARFFVHSGLEAQDMLLEIFRDGRRVERRELRSGKDGGIVEIAVGDEHRGGFGVALTSLRDHQLMRATATVFVPWDDRELTVEFATFRDRLRPGDRETWRVVVKGADSSTVDRGAAELLAYMYDRSLDIFAPHRPPDPRSLYPRRTAVAPVASNLGTAQRAWTLSHNFVTLPDYPRFNPDRLKFFDGYGIGGPGRRGVMKHRAAPQMMQMRTMDAASAAPQAVMAEAAPEGLAEAEEAGGEPPEEPPAADTTDLRSDFSETAFWEPHLLTADDGSAAIEFTVPDSVTEWNVWVHALTRDLHSGSLESQTRSAKELLVRPYLPRFFREGDRAELKVVVNNAGEEELAGRLDFEIVDPDTGESLLAEFGLPAGGASVPFSVSPGAGTNLSFPVRVPHRVGPVAVRVQGRAGAWSDGELRPLAVLPGRLHLAQSRFAALHDQDRRTLRFADLEADDDPTRIDQQLVVTLDAQLFYSVLHALPYLASYPYECTEQLLNRFLSTGIVSSLYDEYPSVARMAKEFSSRETRLERWDDADPNRRMALEETPWLRSARGGEDDAADLVNVLDPGIARAEREAALAKLREAQTSLGGFPWWPGGPPSPYLTLYLLQGFSRALEFDVEVPRDMVVKAWGYMHRHYLDRMVRDMTREGCCWELVTYLNFVLSSYPDMSWTGGVFTDDDRRKMLDFSFRHWRRHSPRLKGYLALTLERAARAEDAELVCASVMDSAKTTRDEGTFWAPEDRAWLWYNDTIETHAFALRALTELEPDDGRRHGVVQWLFLNKKLNHWKSTRATAEVIYSLVHYLEREGALGVREEATVTMGPRRRTVTFEPGSYTGKKSQIVVAGDDVSPAMATIEVEKETKGFMFASATWHFSTERLPEEARGDFFSVERSYFKREASGREWVLRPLADGAALEPGDQVEVRISLRSKHAAEYVHLRDPRGAGFEPETTASQYKWDLGVGWYEEVRDSGTNFFFEWLPVGEYTFRYRLRANLAGTFRVGPATVQSMYAPEFVAYSSGAELEIEP